MSVLIVIPTVSGRNNIFNKCVDAYKETCYEADFWYTFNRKTCAEAWNEGANVAKTWGYDYIHMTADDLIPHNGWYECALDTIQAGLYLPGALIYRPDGSVESFGNQIQEEWTKLEGGSVPFCKTEDWVNIPNIHYWSDNAYDYAQKKVNNYSFVARNDYAFTHYSATPGRKFMDQVERTIFEEWKETL